MNKAYPANTDIADVLERIADLLEAQDANPYRVNAYRRGAKVISTLSRSTAEMASDDDQKLEDLPDIGKRIVAVVKEYADTGLSSMLERLENQISAEDLFTTVPGIGEALARRIHADLDVDTLEGLELAAYDGRLQTVAGIGHRRAKSIRDSVSAILNRSGRRRARKIRQFEKATSGRLRHR
jgi:DNA polymerase/3'-5' exonuclease PolX